MKIIALPEVEQYLEELKIILFEKEYFSFGEEAQKYVDDLFLDIKTNLPTKLKRPAPPYFDRYGKGMYYAVFKKKQTNVMVRFLQDIRGKRRTNIPNTIHRKQPHCGTTYIIQLIT